MNADYTVNKVSQKLLKDIKSSLESIEGWGSMEVYVQDGVVTQITVRNIKKTPTARKYKNGNK